MDGSVRSAKPVGGESTALAIPDLSISSSDQDKSQLRPPASPAPTRLPAAAFTRNGGLKWWWKSIVVVPEAAKAGRRGSIAAVAATAPVARRSRRLRRDNLERIS